MIVDDASMLFMIVEHSRAATQRPCIAGSRSGQVAPTGLEYLGSWVTEDLRGYQVMECDHRSLLEEWMGPEDLVRFEVIEVMSSADAVAAVAGPRRACSYPAGGETSSRLSGGAA